jgi:uracil-DNA glycosylase
MNPSDINIEPSWKGALSQEFQKDYFEKIVQYIKTCYKEGKVIYPPGPLIFHAFKLTPLYNVKVVILGQDPYHNPGEAMGLCFSVPKGVRLPPSLKNIYKELQTDLSVPIPDHGDLSAWANQGVLLLNAMLTVEKNKAGSHRKIGWQLFTDAIIKLLSDHKSNLVFMLWGNFAKSKSVLIDSSKHLILEAAHPSPLARGAYFGSKHFSQANNYLKTNNISPIEWKITE